MENNEKKYKRKWSWKLTEEEISNLINKKLAYIIVELEHSPTSYIIAEKADLIRCNKEDSTV